MKKILVVLLSFILFIPLSFVKAETKDWYDGSFEVEWNKSAALADGSDYILLTTRSWASAMPGENQYTYGLIAVFPDNSIEVSGDYERKYDEACPGSFAIRTKLNTPLTLKSTTAGTKTVYFEHILNGKGTSLIGCDFATKYKDVNIALKFTEPPKPIKKSVQSNTSSTSAVILPTKPALSLSQSARITSAGKSIAIADASATQTINTSQKLTFSGTTSPNAKVTLTIHSDPITKEVTADATGAWSYTLDPKALNLPTGDHTVTAIATDTAGVASDEVSLAKFTLKEPPRLIEGPNPEPYNFFNMLNIVGGAVALILIGLLIWLEMKRRRSSLDNFNSLNI